jgi:Right handed beta helix region
MKKRTLLVASAIAFVVALSSSSAESGGPPCAKIFVSPSGDDSKSGLSQSDAFATIGRAREEVRKIIGSGKLPKGPVAVEILGGTYPLTGSISFGNEDSGTADNPVIYRAFENQPVRLTGCRAVKISDCKPVTDPAILERMDPAARGHVVSISAEALGLKHSGPFPDKFDDQGGLFEIFSSGKRLPLSRWPNGGGYTTMKRVLVVGDKTTPGVFEYRDDRPARWGKNDSIWLKGQWRVGWEDPALRVASVDPAARTITFAVGLPNGIGCKYKRPEGSGEEPWCAINLLEEIDQPGEWAMDFTTKTIYLWPPDSSPGSEIQISQLDQPMISVNGASNLSFIGLTLESSLGDGFVLDGVENCLVAGCTVRDLAGRGIVVDGVHSGVLSCDVHDVGEGAVYISGGDRKTLAKSENFVINNHLHHYGLLKHQYSAGVHVGALANPVNPKDVRDAVGIRIAHNVIHHAPRDAVLYSGNDNVYELNDIYYCAYDTKDTGAFYSWLDWTMRGNVIRYNFIHDTVGGVNPDDGASGNTVYGNVFAGPRVGVWIASGPDNVIRHNIFVKDQGSVFGMDDRGSSRGYATNARLINRVNEVNPAEEPWKSAHPEVAGMLEKSPELPWRTEFVGNLIVSNNPKPSEIKIKPALAGDPEIFLEKDNLTVAGDPGFVDAFKGDYALKSGSEVFTKIPGFQPIPFDKIGLYIDEYRRALPPPEEFQRTPEYSPYKEDHDNNFGT